MRIVIVTNNYKPYSGGVVSSIDSFVTNLKLLNHQVKIITLDFIRSDINDEGDVHRINCPIKFLYKNNPIAIPLQPYKDLLYLIKSFQPNIIHSQHPFFLGQSALKISKKLNIPIVFTYHTQYEEYLHYVPLPKTIIKPIVKFITTKYCNQTDGIIAPSESIYNHLKQNDITKNIRVIPSGILPIFESNYFTAKKISRPFHILTVSRFVKEKNIYFLLDVFSKLNKDDFIFTLIGFGSELQNLKNYAYNKLKLTKEIQFIEKPPKEIISLFYKNCDVFIFSSITETQGLVLAEAMASGTPVVALKAPGVCDIVKHGVNGFLVNSVNEMVETIVRLSLDTNLFNKMQKEAWNFSKNYNAKNLSKLLVDFYSEAIFNKLIS